jgi:hypothetical protein
MAEMAISAPPCRLEPEQVVDVAARVTGQLIKFGDEPQNPGKSIDFNWQVEKGTILAFLDDARYRARCPLTGWPAHRTMISPSWTPVAAALPREEPP